MSESTGKQYILDILAMGEDELDVELSAVSAKRLKTNLRLALLEQDRDTRHACAEAVLQCDEACETATGNSAISPDAAHASVMNCHDGVKNVPKEVCGSSAVIEPTALSVKKVEPLDPRNMTKHKAEALPDAVFEVFNELIAEKWNGYAARFIQKEAARRIVEKLDCSIEDVYAKHYLDVEDVYRVRGWHVEYDKPGYNESYEASFEFSIKK